MAAKKAGPAAEPRVTQKRLISEAVAGDGPRRLTRDRVTGRTIRRNVTARTAAGGLGPIVPGCEIYCFTMGKFSMVDVLEHCLAATGPADVTLATWAASGCDITAAHRLLVNGAIRSMKFIIDASFPTMSPGYCAALRQAFGDDAIRLTKNHAKFATMRNDRWNLCVRTSMNLNENRRLEFVEVSDSPELAAFIVETVDRVFTTQAAGECFRVGRNEVERRFGEEFGDGEGPFVPEPGETNFFGDGPTAVDLRRSGVSRRC